MSLFTNEEQKKGEKRLALDVSSTSATCAAPVHDVTDRDCLGAGGKMASLTVVLLQHSVVDFKQTGLKIK